MTKYEEFLASKAVVDVPTGIEPPADFGGIMFDWQRDIVGWALRRGRAAIFAGCGLGKTAMQLEWANHVPGRVLILAPLAVAAQTVREADKFGIDGAKYLREDDGATPIVVTNYEMLEHFDPSGFVGIVLDESSILKSFGGTTRKAMTEWASSVPFRLCCTATPAPNDLIEMTNHAEFLDILTGKEIIALYFTQDGNTTHAWRLKGHAHAPFYRWLASWSVALRSPSDVGGDDDGFDLPPLTVKQITVESRALPGMLFPTEASTMSERLAARRDSVGERVAACAELVNSEPDHQWLVWCNLNGEGDALRKSIPGAVEVRGSDSPEVKESRLEAFTRGELRVLISKPSICGFGMNWQACDRIAFVGLSDSWEQYYQATRRCWRFGQKNEVRSFLITAEAEGAVLKNIQRKDRNAAAMMDSLVSSMKGFNEVMESRNEKTNIHEQDEATGDGWRMMLGDSCERIDDVETESVGLSVFSPPFPGMYAYTNSARDMGNTSGIDEFMVHFRFLMGKDKLMRTLKPGRMCAIHLCQLTAMLGRDGYIGLKDYRGEVIKMMIEEGWVFAGEVTIDKNPQVQATRNKERGLLFKTLATDSSLMRMALADYMIYFRKPGKNEEPIRAGISERHANPDGWITEQEWIEWASPVWYRHVKGANAGGIRETDVLNVKAARDSEDERHLCPLQLGVIERAVKLWSAPDDLVLSPFGGIGSEGHGALTFGRRFVGIELKRSYWRQACKNLEQVKTMGQQTLFEGTP